MRKMYSVFVVGSLTLLLGGCFWQSAPENVEYKEPEVTIEEAMDAAEFTPEDAETQMVSDDDALETIEGGLDATIILEEDLSDL